jgi:(S)-3,5-dihydroxyphenylglycine transaminase
MINTINPMLENLKEDVMGFLNEIQLSYPNALSLASGRPDRNFFDFADISKYIDIYLKYASHNNMLNDINDLGQYNKAKGIINDFVSKYLEKEYAIKANPESILINVGTQESLLIAVMTLCDKENDIIVVENPAYIGLTHYSLLEGYKLEPVDVKSDGICLDSLRQKITQVESNGKKVKIVYVTPDFQNPTGVIMSIENRLKLLKMAEEHDFYILEDNAYGDFVLEGEKKPTLKSLDEMKRVIYLHSLSKIIYPALRIGIMVVDQVINGLIISDLMAKVKGYTTVNTPSLTQIAFAGILIENKFSLQNYNDKKLKNLFLRRALVLQALDKYFIQNDEDWSRKIIWNKPKGGFFLTLKLPIKILKEDVIECAKRFNVICTPMSFFYLNEGGENEIRLAYSYVEIEKIDTAICNLSEYLKFKINKEK